MFLGNWVMSFVFRKKSYPCYGQVILYWPYSTSLSIVSRQLSQKVCPQVEINRGRFVELNSFSHTWHCNSLSIT
jgi:hypothetical protein